MVSWAGRGVGFKPPHCSEAQNGLSTEPWGHPWGPVAPSPQPSRRAWAPLVGCGLSCWGRLCFLYGVGVSLCGGTATRLQDPNQEEGVHPGCWAQGDGGQQQRGREKSLPRPALPTRAPWGSGLEPCDLSSGPTMTWVPEGCGQTPCCVPTEPAWGRGGGVGRQFPSDSPPRDPIPS